MQYPSSKHSSWKVRTVLTVSAFIFALSLIASVSSQQSPDDRRRSRIRSRFRPKKRIEDSETAAILAENDKNNDDDGIVGSVVGSSATARQLRTRNRIRQRRPTIVTPEPPALFDDDEVCLSNINFCYYLSLSWN